jgi:lipopolysaccharide transport system permease protein
MAGEYKNKVKSIIGLSLSLAKANFKLRNEGSYLGIFWYILEPLLMFLILMVMQGAFSISLDTRTYAIYLLLGLIMYNFFTKASSDSISAITNSGSYIKSMKIHPEPLILSRVIQSTFSHFFEIVVLIIFMIILKSSLVNLLFYPLIFIMFFIFVLGVSFIFATINVYLIDFTNIWNVFSRILWLATPIFYTIKPGTLIYKLNLLNPLYYFMDVSRTIIIYHKIPALSSIMIIIAISVITLLFGIFIFNKYKKKFAEKI